jgi:hypothetical protein
MLMFDIKRIELYQQEMMDFKTKASKIKIPATRREVDKLLITLEEQIKLINDAHSPNMTAKASPKAVHENIEISAAIRWQLKTLLRD